MPLQWRRRCGKAMLRVCSLRLGSSAGACDCFVFSLLLAKLVFKSAANSLTVCFVWLLRKQLVERQNYSGVNVLYADFTLKMRFVVVVVVFVFVFVCFFQKNSFENI